MEEIQYQVLDLNHYAARIEGHHPETYEPCPSSLEVGDVKYYEGVPYSPSNKKIEYYFIVATVKAPSNDYKNKIVDRVIGMVELQKSPYDSNVIWLDFLSVAPEYKNKGIGKKLAYEMCNFLKDKPWSLERSRPSDEGLKYIKSIIDNLVEKHSIAVIARPKY